MKATMLILNTIGAIVCRHINLIELSESDTHVTLKYKMRGGRKIQGYKISKNETSLVLSKGWKIPDGMIESKPGVFGYNSFVTFDKDKFIDVVSKELVEVFYQH
jgi:hypothetical protein